MIVDRLVTDAPPTLRMLHVLRSLAMKKFLAAFRRIKGLLKTDLAPDFIMEIPPVRPPNLKNLLLKTYYRLKWFAIEAVPLFMIGAGLLFVIDKLALLGIIKRWIAPLITAPK